ncbi:MAG: hypothetical protein HY671_14895 [Chloroflexi bacterium]|nr:hypothetical protein [Chloroflexota bacterium]
MRLVVESNFDLWGEFIRQEVEVEGQDVKLEDLLKAVAKNSDGRYQIIDPETGEVDPFDYAVFLKGCAYQLLPQRLKTRLNEGEKVLITKWMDILGGG